MTATTVVCPHCGAHNSSEAEWCTQCYARLDELPADLEDPRAEAAGQEEREFAHPDSSVGPPGRVVYSRWRKSEITFGPFGRIFLTVLVIAVGVALGFNYTPIPAVIWLFLAVPVLLRQIWKKAPIGYRPPPPPVAPPTPKEQRPIPPGPASS